MSEYTATRDFEMTKIEAAAAFRAADAAWEAELIAIWGDNTNDVRYTKYASGEYGSPLHTAYRARIEAHDAWLVANDLVRVSA